MILADMTNLYFCGTQRCPEALLNASAAQPRGFRWVLPSPHYWGLTRVGLWAAPLSPLTGRTPGVLGFSNSRDRWEGDESYVQCKFLEIYSWWIVAPYPLVIPPQPSSFCHSPLFRAIHIPGHPVRQSPFLTFISLVLTNVLITTSLDL